MMEEEGWIKGCVVLLDPMKLGLKLSVFVQVRTDNHHADWMEQVKETTALPLHPV